MMIFIQRTEEYNFIRLLHKFKVQKKRKLNNLLDGFVKGKQRKALTVAVLFFLKSIRGILKETK
jgi:hypothetical protein